MKAPKTLDKLIFLHLPKCGGNTLHSILERFYSPRETHSIKVIDHVRLNTEVFTGLNQARRDKIKLLKGHMEFGLHKHFTAPSCYITILRKPVSRIISYYYYVKRKPNHRLRIEGKFKNDMSLLEFAESMNEYDIHNAQVRLISGINDKPELMLEKALENIDKHFSFVGNIENFDESLILLQSIYNWPVPKYRITNRTANRPSKDLVDRETLELTAELNEGDQQLWTIVNQKLQEMIISHNGGISETENLNTLSSYEHYKHKIRKRLFY